MSQKPLKNFVFRKSSTYICVVMIETLDISQQYKNKLVPSPNGSPYTHTTHTSEPALREAGSHFSKVYGNYEKLEGKWKSTTIIISDDFTSAYGRNLCVCSNISVRNRSIVSENAQQDGKKNCE